MIPDISLTVQKEQSFADKSYITNLVNYNELQNVNVLIDCPSLFP